MVSDTARHPSPPRRRRPAATILFICCALALAFATVAAARPGYAKPTRGAGVPNPPGNSSPVAARPRQVITDNRALNAGIPRVRAQMGARSRVTTNIQAPNTVGANRRRAVKDMNAQNTRENRVQNTGENRVQVT